MNESDTPKNNRLDLNSLIRKLQASRPVIKYIAFILILSTIFASIILQQRKSYTNQIQDLSKQLELIQNLYVQEAKTKAAENTPTIKEEKIYCPTSKAEQATFTSDGKYYLYRWSGSYYICDYSNPDDPHMIKEYEGRVQNKYTLILTLYGSKMFIADLANKTLKYIGYEDIPDKSTYMSDGKLYLMFFGPKEEDLDHFSPSGDKLFFGAATCHDCMTLIQNYVLDLKTGKITYLGVGNNSVKWVNNNTVSWTEYAVREKTQEEVMEDPYGFPAITENKGTKTLTID